VILELVLVGMFVAMAAVELIVALGEGGRRP